VRAVAGADEGGEGTEVRRKIEACLGAHANGVEFANSVRVGCT
jgi:hypothetical protein